MEVLKGPASTLYGILDPGGLINVVTKRPETRFGGSISATSSSFGGGTGQVDVTGPIDGTRVASSPNQVNDGAIKVLRSLPKLRQ